MEPTIITSAAIALGQIAFEGILSNRADGAFCKYGNDLIKRISINFQTPENHDILKAARKSQINSTLVAVKSVGAKYNFWDNFSSNAPKNLKQVCHYLYKEINRLEKGKLENLTPFDPSDLGNILTPRGLSADVYVEELAQTQKLQMLQELQAAKLEWVEIELKEAILHGWEENGEHLDWYQLYCAFFAEELKTNQRLSTIVQLEYLEKIDAGHNAIQQNMDALIGRVESFMPQAQSLVEIIYENRADILSAIGDVSKDTQAIKTKLGGIDEKLNQLVSTREAPGPAYLFSPHLNWKQDLEGDIGKAALRILNFVNRQAELLYQHHILDAEAAGIDEYVWDEIFGTEEFVAQAEFVQTISQDNQEVPYATFKAIEDGQTRIWLVGEAGVGKTTTLYNVYFSMFNEQFEGVPMLVQPQEFDSYDIDLFDHSADILETLIIVWLQNRGILSKTYKEEGRFDLYRKDPLIQQLIRQFGSDLKSGRIVLLIDSFDELSRMAFQAEIFRKIFKTSRRYICASRPETYLQHLHEHLKIQIRAPWAIPTIEKYIYKKSALPDKRKSLIFEFIQKNEQIDWLKNPRYLNLLIEHIRQNEAMAKNKFGKKEILDFLSNGEYALFHKIFGSAFDRIDRYLKLKGEKGHKQKVEQLLTKIAISQLEVGNYTLMDAEREEDPHYWKAILSESSLIKRKTRTGKDDGELISLLNHNLVDYYISDDITNQLLDQSLSKEKIGFKQLWTKNLLKYISQYMHERCAAGQLAPGEVIEILWKRVQQLKLADLSPDAAYRDEDVYLPFESQFQTINLIQLIIQFEKDRQEKQNPSKQASIRFSNRTNFSNLDLSNIDLKGVQFSSCDFSGSILYGANFTEAAFDNCTFLNVNFRLANASGASFKACTFNFDKAPKNTAISKLQIKNIAIKSTYFKSERAAVTPETLRAYGAIDIGSRYASKFGKDFLKNQKKYLGPGLKQAEDYYMYEAIMPFIQTLSKRKNEILLVDLMAGGNNDRIKNFFKENEKLSILAIDKDTEQLKEVQTQVGFRFKVVKERISGEIGLQKIIESLFNTTVDKYAARFGLKAIKNKADLIIGKKAIHEIGRQQQQALLQDCYQALHPGGRLILFTDSPVSLTQDGFERLQELKRIVQNESGAEVVRHELIDQLTLSEEPDDVAIFSNLWVLLKDWANRNRSEVQQRYFSSISEIEDWGKDLGFKLVRSPFRAHYDLIAKFFNEFAFNQIELLLERLNNDQLTTASKQLIAQYLEGTPAHRVFFDFAEHHLFGGSQSDVQTRLGATLEAKRISLADKFREVNPKLENINLPYQSGAAFQFSVHVVEFEKPMDA